MSNEIDVHLDFMLAETERQQELNPGQTFEEHMLRACMAWKKFKKEIKIEFNRCHRIKPNRSDLFQDFMSENIMYQKFMDIRRPSTTCVQNAALLKYMQMYAFVYIL